MKTISDNMEKLPFFINMKEGFVKFTQHGAKIVFMGHTKNVRAATPIYGTMSDAVDIAKSLVRMPSVSSVEYFCIMQPALIGFDKDKEIK